MQQNLHIHQHQYGSAQPTVVNVYVEAKSSAQWKAENYARNINNFCNQIEAGINRHIATEKAKGNPHFINVETHEQYLKAVRLEELDQRKREGIGSQILGWVGDCIFGE